MKCKKVLTTLVVVALVVSTMLVINKLTDFKFVEGASAVVPGVDQFNNNILNNTEAQLTTIKVGNTVTLKFNGSTITETNRLYYPQYFTDWKSGYSEVWCNWTDYGISIESPVGLGTTTDKSVTFNRAGLWLVAAVSDPALWHVGMNDMLVADPADSSNWESITGWIWVNSSDDWDISLSKNEVAYDKNETITITVTENGATLTDTKMYIDIWNVDDATPAGGGVHSLAFHKELDASYDGVWEISGTEMYGITHLVGAGTYRVTAYKDDYPGPIPLPNAPEWDQDDRIYGDSTTGTTGSTYNGERGYNNTFGHTTFWASRFIKSAPTTQIRAWDKQLVSTATWKATGGANTTYRYETCGPFNPPEHWADYVNFTVNAGVPTFSVTNGTQFWNDSHTNEVKIVVKDYGGNNITASGLTVQLFNSSNRPSRSTSRSIPSSFYNVDKSNGATIAITPNGTGTPDPGDNRWGWNSSYGIWAGKGNLYVVVRQTSLGNDSEEWNGTATIKLVSAINRFVWVNDGDTPADDGELGDIPARNAVPIDISFKIQGSDYTYFGQLNGDSGDCITKTECAENITITGNSLFTGSIDQIPNFAEGWFANEKWTIPIIPTMSINGGEITITATAWNSTITAKLSIGGTSYWQNGTVVTVTPNKFDIDVENKTLVITVQTAAGLEIPGATVTLYYIDETIWDTGLGIKDGAGELVDSVTSDATGAYSIHFNTTQQTMNQSATSNMNPTGGQAPRNLTVVVTSGSMWGYAKITMDPNSDLEVETSRSTMLAGQTYEEFYINCTLVGNTTDTPSTATADKNAFAFYIYNENNEDVTDTILNDGGYTSTDLDADYDILLYDVYITNPGTYTIYGKNNTHDSEGFNATLVVEQVEVSASYDDGTTGPLIWKYDENRSATFTVTYNGNPVNGSLIIDNLTDIGDYNQTWKNCSFDGTSDQGGNTSTVISEDSLVNGVITVHDITSNYLPQDVAEQNITFWFQPVDDEGDAGEYARAIGNTPVSVPTVTPSPQLIPLGRTTTVNIEVTGRGTFLSGIYIGLDGAGVDVSDTNTSSNVDGIAQFALNPASTGDIDIHVGAENRIVTTKLTVTGWILDISADVAQVDEGGSFTVTAVKQGTTTAVEGADITISGIGSAQTDSDGKATFTAPEVTSDRTYAITASAEGYAPDPDALTMTVINVPKLILSVEETIAAGATIEVAVAKDTGDPVIGATVTVSWSETVYKTKAGGVVNVKLSDTLKAGEYTITASFGTFKDATLTVTVTKAKDTPGFELLTLIIALGVAFILLRRRRR